MRSQGYDPIGGNTASLFPRSGRSRGPLPVNDGDQDDPMGMGGITPPNLKDQNPGPMAPMPLPEGVDLGQILGQIGNPGRMGTMPVPGGPGAGIGAGVGVPSLGGAPSARDLIMQELVKSIGGVRR